ncbi:MAG: double-stranded uracil-DNA glycosylase [Patescibacteria group bacterium]|nr:double-stranded uracil-DNA glycosylase [Patescibacteria group bacterium]
MTGDELPVPDIITKDLNILFCGINPGLLSAATHHHFARPGNRFWKALFLSGLIPQQMQPSQQSELLTYRIGITNFVTRPSATANELSAEEFRLGAQELRKKITKYTPRYLAVLGIDAYKKGFDTKSVSLGLQTDLLGKTRVWLLPNPSGLNAHYSLDDFVRLFTELKTAVDHA